MQFKLITAILVLLLVIASLLAAGCTTSTTSNMNETSRATLLENYLTAYKNTTYSNKNKSITAWEVTMINNTSARVGKAYHDKSSNLTVTTVDTIIVFPTSQDATDYLDAVNKTNYELASTEIPSGSYPYLDATGHAPQIFKAYRLLQGELIQGRKPSNTTSTTNATAGYFSEIRLIEQIDNMIIVSDNRYSGTA